MVVITLSGFGEDAAPSVRGLAKPLLNSERIEAKFGSYGIDVLEHAPHRVSMLYSTQEGAKICRTFAIVSFVEPVAKPLQSALDEVKAGGSLGATLKEAGWIVEKHPLYVGTLRSGLRFQKLARLEQPHDLATAIYELSASLEEATHKVATVIEIHHPAYLDLAQLQALVPGALVQSRNNRIGELCRLATLEMHEGKAGRTHPTSPRIETDAAGMARAKERVAGGQEPFATYWNLAVANAEKALTLAPRPVDTGDALAFHGAVQAQGTATRLLAYRWRLEDHEVSGEKAVALLDAWASAKPLPGTTFDPAIRFPNAGMDVARGMLPFVAAFDLLEGHPALTEETRGRIETWFRALVPVIREGIRRWEENDDFGGQEFQNHHVAHMLGMALFGSALRDEEMIRFALDSPDNPKDFKELVAGLILMPGDEPHGGLRGKPLHPGELQDRVRTNHGAGLTYCHLSLTLMLYAAEVLGRATGEDWIDWTTPGGESLRLSATFYSDFFRLRNARINGDYYFRDRAALQNNRPFQGIFEVALGHWPEVPNLKAMVRSTDRARTPRSWLNYYGLPLLTHGVDDP